MTNKVVLIDMDSVIVDLLQPWLDLYNDEYKDDLQIEDIDRWNTHELASCGEEIYKYLTPDFFASLPPLPGAVEAINDLKKNFTIVVVTASPNAESMGAKAVWCQKHLGLGLHNFMAAKKKYLVQGDVLIDDSPKNIKQYKEHNPTKKVFTIAYPYNEDCRNIVDLYAQSWADTENAWIEIVEAINELE